MRTALAPALALAALLLAGCNGPTDPSASGAGDAAGGPTSSGTGASVSPLAALTRFVPSLGGGRPTGTLDPSALAGADVRGAMWLPSFTQPGPAILVQDNGGDRTFSSPYGFDAAFDGGLLVGTRGLPDDLMGAAVGEVARALRAGGGRAVRLHDTLDSLDQVVQTRFECEIVRGEIESVELGARTASARKFTETCSNPRLVFENLYWLGEGGEIVASRQFVSQTVAYLRFSRI